MASHHSPSCRMQCPIRLRGRHHHSGPGTPSTNTEPCGFVWVLSTGPKHPLSKTHLSHGSECCRWLCQDPSPHQGCPGQRDHRLWCWMMPTATAGTCRSSACAQRMGGALGVKATALPCLLHPGDIVSGGVSCWGFQVLSPRGSFHPQCSAQPNLFPS